MHFSATPRPIGVEALVLVYEFYLRVQGSTRPDRVALTGDVLALQNVAPASSTPLLVRGGCSQRGSKGPISDELQVLGGRVLGLFEQVDEVLGLLRAQGLGCGADVLRLGLAQHLLRDVVEGLGGVLRAA